VKKLPEIPKHVRGVLFDYKVVQVERFDDPDMYGDIDCDKGIIRVLKNLEPAIKWQAFLHEFLHACEQEVGLKDLKDKKGDSDVDRLALAMFSLWRRNNWVLPGDGYE